MDRFKVWLRGHVTPWRWALVGMLLLEIAWMVCPPPGWLVERWYSQGFYRLVEAVFVPLQNVLPVPVVSVIITALVTATLALGIRKGRHLGRAGKSRWRLVPWFLGVAVQFTIPLVLWMLVIWGAGYQRPPVTARWSLDNTPLTREEAQRLEEQLLAVINANIQDAGQCSRDDAVAAIAASMERVLRARGDRAVRLPHQVCTTPPGLFLTFATGGMCVPAAIEPFVDGAYDPVTFVRVAAHELGHIAGYNRESEATLVGYMAGLGADNALARYAVALGIYMDLISRIHDKDVRQAAWEALPQKARDDVRKGREIARRYVIKIRFLQKVGYHVYDTYLKSQGIHEGFANYSAGLRLFAGAWRDGTVRVAPGTPK